ncbi:MAG: DUF5715 family protein [Terracidiphilus sp.]|jgi:hypothetical protein
MLRTALLALALAALPAASAIASPVLSAKTHRSVSTAVSFHRSPKKANRPAAVKAGHAGRPKVRYAVLRETRRTVGRGRARRGQTTVQAAELQVSRADMPPPLAGSLQSLVRQNDKTEADSLERIEDEDDLADRIGRGMLVPVPASAALTVNAKLPESHRYCRPWTAQFLSDLARVHGAEFHRPLEVSSAVRTVEYQKRLMEINGNAAPAEGDIASPHLTGASIDIAKQGMSRQEIGWMRSWLLPLQEEGKIDVEEEFQQACFHITVYKSYAPPAPPPTEAEEIASQGL